MITTIALFRCFIRTPSSDTLLIKTLLEKKTLEVKLGEFHSPEGEQYPNILLRHFVSLLLIDFKIM